MTHHYKFDVLYTIPMKKKTVSHKTRRASTPKQTILFRRILIITTCVIIVTGMLVWINKSSIGRAVAGASIMKGLFVQGTISMPTLSEVTSFNIYYKEAGEKEFTNSVRNISPTVSSYTISHLKKNTHYQYRFAAVNDKGQEYLFSEILPLTNIEPM